MDKKPLTDRQSSVLGYLNDFKAYNDRMPTYKEIADGMQFKSVNSATCHVKAIEKKGYLGITPNISRGIVLL